MANVIFEKMISDPLLNIHSREQILTPEDLDKIAIAVTHFAFRNGPIEDMHSNGQLSQEDMLTLNKFTVNRLLYVFHLIVEERWVEFEYLIRSKAIFGTGWDKPEMNDGCNKLLLKHEIVKKQTEKEQILQEIGEIKLRNPYLVS